MPDPNNPTRPAARSAGGERLSPADILTNPSPFLPPGIELNSPIADILSIKLPKTTREVVAMIPPLSAELRSEDYGFTGAKLAGHFDPLTRTGIVTAGYQGTFTGENAVLSSNMLAWNKFDGTGTHAAGVLQVGGTGPFAAKAGVVFAVGQENHLAATASIQDWLRATYSNQNGLRLTADQMFYISGVRINLSLNLGFEGRGRVNGGAGLEFIK